MKKVQIGDRVAYSIQFLRSIGATTGEMAQWRGVVVAFIHFGKGKRLVEVQWEGTAGISGSAPMRVLESNLARVGANSRFCAC